MKRALALAARLPSGAAALNVMGMPVAVTIAAALASATALSRVVSSRRSGLAVTWHRVPWRIERRVRVVHLTDVHVGPTTPRRVLRRVAETVHGVGADLVVITGDYVNVSLTYLDRVTELAHALPKPCLATLGNHDHWTDPVRVTRALEDGGVKVLRNASTTVEGPGFTLPVVGVDDGCSGNADVDRAFSDVDHRDRDRTLVLSHFPNTADTIASKEPPLVLSGHTHAGQIDVPHLTRYLARVSGNPYLRGFHRVGPRTDLYVSAGIGHSLEGLRGGPTNPEIAVFELDPAVKERRSHALLTPLRAKVR